MVLEQGVLEGRRTYANMMKYIKMTASSNFGNMFSVLAASAFLPFLPMASLHLIFAQLDLRRLLHRHVLGQRGPGVPEGPQKVGGQGHWPVYAVDGAHQLGV